ncbi:TKL family protein kinase [Tritrichomonas foetus]|uniref:TKL family protein kinase n=1 Tax=Tritrichomonas foetus TaxID=1144522 RepID=A0A1J4KZZ2_9EUKA|nr:TKL family protein kinase [Tritrichomonas foetus]|eukprot:OHT15260.1 TKL family protein kinase [Tritrichomonas foetus]
MRSETVVFSTNDMCQELSRQLSEMKKVSLQAVAHRKKFQLALSQFSRFIDHLLPISSDNPLTSLQQESFRGIMGITREYHQIFSQNFLHCWAHTAIDNPSSQTATDLCAISNRLHDFAQSFDEDAANVFDSADPQWLQFHILDLKAIIASFNQYITSPNPNPQVVDIMNEKLKSINNFLDECENEDIVPGARVFSPIPINYQIWRIEHSDFIEESEEGSGGLAVVYFGHFLKTGEEVAIKKLKFSKLSGAHLRVFQREVTILATAQHPTLLKFIGATDTMPFCILTEWMPGGSLYHELHQYHNLSATQLTICAIDIARGMNFLHSMQIIHRDLKSLNVLLDSEGRAKICDFGFSRYKTKDEETMTQNVGTPHWMAPELLGGSTTYNEKIDVYAYGIVLWEILTKKLPYSGLESTMIIGQVLLNNIRPAIPDGTPPGLRSLIESCWARDAESRPSFAEILKCWRSGEVIYPDADREIVRRHLDETLDEQDRASNDVESHLSSEESPGLLEFAETLEKDGIPADLVERCWENLLSLPHEGLEDVFVNCLALFFKTTAASRAVSKLRTMPAGSVPRKVAIECVTLIPTGDPTQDDDIVMIACKNGAACEAAIHALQHRHLKIALEVIARKGIIPKHKDIIIQTCIRCFSVRDDPLVSVAALRCLVGNNAVKQISIQHIKEFINSRNTTLKNAALIAAAKMADENVKMPNDLIESLISNWHEQSLAGIFLVKSCKNIETASYILNRLAYGIPPTSDLTLRILIQISKHVELRKQLKTTIEQLIIGRSNPAITKALSILRNLPDNG